MQKTFKGFIFLAMLSGLLSCAYGQKPSDTTWTEKKAAKWFKSKEWAGGLKLNAHKSTDKIEFARQYQKNKALWDKAFAYLKDTDLENIKVGRYPIQGTDLSASVTEAPSKEFDKTNWESHRKYIDLQYVIKGKEKIGVAPVAKATVTKPYDEKGDGANYSAEGTYYILEPGTFFLFFPTDAHRPNIKVEGYDLVKKIVLKIKVAD